MPRMLTEEEVEKIEQQRALRDRARAARSTAGINWNLGVPRPRMTSRELGREVTRIEGRMKKPTYGEGLTEEDQRALRKMDEDRAFHLRQDAKLEASIERKNAEEAKKGIEASSNEELVEALDDMDENASPYMRTTIMNELRKRGLSKQDYDLYRWTDTGVEAREARIEELQKEFDAAQEEQQRWAGLAQSHKKTKMRRRYGRWAEQGEKRLDEIEKKLNELKGLKATRSEDE